LAFRCERCPYSGAAAGTRGDPNAPVCVVGEAPGAEELRSGLPFVGQSGKLLSRALSRVGIDESQVYFTNALRCRPPIGKAPPREAIEACRSRLLAEVGSAERKVTIALGGSALKSLLGDHSLKITSERGKAFTTDWGVVVTANHPAFILRSHGEYPRFVADLRYAAGFLQGAKVKDPGVTRWDLVTPQNIRRVVDFLLTQEYLAADIETSGFNALTDQILCLSVAWTKNRVAVFPINHPLDGRSLWPDNVVVNFGRQIIRLLEAPGPKWIWHNGKYDTSFLRTVGADARVDEDCMLMHYSLNEQRGTHDLGQLASDYLGAPNWKDKMVEEAIAKGYIKKRSESWAKIPPDVMYPYNARDADLTYQLFFQLRAEQERPKNFGLPKLYRHLLVPASRFLQDVERYGMWVNTDYLDKADEEYQARLEVERHDILTAVEPLFDVARYQKVTGAGKLKGGIFNPGSPKQKLYVLRDVLGFRITDTRRETLEDLPDNELVSAILRWMKTMKVISTYIHGVQERIDYDGRIHATYLIHGTVTGRLSSRNPNLQNIPRDKTIRNIFQSPPGRVLVEFDYSQAELRVLAVLSDDEFLKQVYRTGRDLHDEVSTALFPNWDPGTFEGQEQRVRAKFLNFGIAYGRGAKSISEEFGMPFSDAQRMVKDWFARAPGAKTYIDSQRAAPTTGALLKTPFGRRRRFNLVTRDTLVPIQNEAVNFAIQSTASDLTLLSGLRIHDCLVKQWNAHITNLVHDSILVEMPEDGDIDGMITYVKGYMEELPRTILHTDVPFTVDAKVGRRWGDLKG
jgi:DNA polymerase I